MHRHRGSVGSEGVHAIGRLGRRGASARAACLAAALLLAAGFAGATRAQSGARRPAEAHDMRLVGYHSLQARSAYQPTVHHQGDRWIAYIGHHGGTEGVPSPLNSLTGQKENNGTSIVDVTDAAHPKYLAAGSPPTGSRILPGMFAPSRGRPRPRISRRARPDLRNDPRLPHRLRTGFGLSAQRSSQRSV